MAQVTPSLKTLFSLIKGSLALRPEEKISLKAYVMLKPEKVETFISILEKEQALISQTINSIQVKHDPNTIAKNIHDKIQQTINKVKNEEITTQEDADKYLETMLSEL